MGGFLDNIMKKILLALVVLFMVGCFGMTEESISEQPAFYEEYEETEEAAELLETTETEEPLEMVELPLVEKPNENELESLEKPDKIAEIIAQMTVEEQIAQLFIVRMPTNLGQAEDLARQGIGGFVFFAENVHSIEQVQRDIERVQNSSRIPLFIAVDEEGGRVSRVGRLFEPTPPALRLTEQGFVFETHRTIGERLAFLGFNMNFAPVADVRTNPANTVIGDRAFSNDAEVAAIMVALAVSGLRSADILPVIKHFPGHGDTVQDSHYQAAFYLHDRERFDAVEALPFISGIESGAAGVMIGHITAPLLTPDTPDTPIIFLDLIQEILREEMGFEGIIITDALDMGGLTNYFTAEEILVNAFLAGSDILLMPVDVQNAQNIMLNAYETGQFSTERLHESLRRILEIKLNLPNFSGGDNG
ncbi:MAG: hypothetical protein FWG65_00950 [Turicibacter sp.]|nr:hypothetical protein [Turicibacter sp.]